MGNILIVVDQTAEESDPEGMLIDWDLCKYREELGQGATQHGRSVSAHVYTLHAGSHVSGVFQGTWAFMSGVSLQYPYKPNDVADDLESFIHVVCFNALRFHQHNMTKITFANVVTEDVLRDINQKNERLAKWVAGMYDECLPVYGVHLGGERKIARSEKGHPGFTLDEGESPLATLILRLYQLLKVHYSAIDFTSLERYAVARPVQSMPPPTFIHRNPPPNRGRVSRHDKPEASSRTSTKATDSIDNQAGTVPHVTAPARRVLDTHEDIMNVFEDVLDAIRLQVKRLGGILKGDKLPDQFLGLRECAIRYSRPQDYTTGCTRSGIRILRRGRGFLNGPGATRRHRNSMLESLVSRPSHPLDVVGKQRKNINYFLSWRVWPQNHEDVDAKTILVPFQSGVVEERTAHHLQHHLMIPKGRG